MRLFLGCCSSSPADLQRQLRRPLVRPRRLHGGRGLHSALLTIPSDAQGVHVPRYAGASSAPGSSRPSSARSRRCWPRAAWRRSSRRSSASPIARLAGVAAAIATLAILVIMFTFIVQTPSITGGSDVHVGVPRETTPRHVAIALVVIIFAVFAFKQSRHGLRLRASRENQEAAQSVCGERAARALHRVRHRRPHLRRGGRALRPLLQSASPRRTSTSTLTFIVVAMLVVGGMQSVAGAVVGTYFLTIVYLIRRRGEVDGVFGDRAAEWHREPPRGGRAAAGADPAPERHYGRQGDALARRLASEGTCRRLRGRHRPGGGQGGDRGRPVAPRRRHPHGAPTPPPRRAESLCERPRPGRRFLDFLRCRSTSGRR